MYYYCMLQGYEGDRTSSTGTLQSSRNYGGSMSSLDSARSTEPFSKSPRMARRQLEEIPEGPSKWTHWGLDKMVSILRTTFSNMFSSLKRLI